LHQEKTADKPVNLNTATSEQLQQVGMAGDRGKILQMRRRMGVQERR